MDLLRNYQALVAKVDEMTAEIISAYPDHITCHRGCDGCCRHLSLSLVEAVALAVALASLPEEQIDHLQNRARTATETGPCPLLEQGACALYDYRPIICRTHGLPIRLVEEGCERIDFCPKNFKGLQSLPGAAIVDIEKLNIILATVNKVFLSQYHSAHGRDRISIAAALILEV